MGFPASKLAVVALLLTGCAVPPKTNDISPECMQASGLSAELERQERMLFKNYDRAKAMLQELRGGGCGVPKNMGQKMGQIIEYSINPPLRAGCVNGYLFVYHLSGGVVQVYDRQHVSPVACE